MNLTDISILSDQYTFCYSFNIIVELSNDCALNSDRFDMQQVGFPMNNICSFPALSALLDIFLKTVKTGFYRSFY